MTGTSWVTKSKLKYPGLESSIYAQKPTVRSFSTPIQGSPTPESPDHNQAFSLELEARPLEEFPFLRQPTQTLAELEKDVIAKGLPGQWFRKILGKKTDITCLPAEMHVEILKNVSFIDQLVCERVCTTWRTIVRRDCASFRYTTIDDSRFSRIKDPEPKETCRIKKPRLGTKTAAQPLVKKPKILVHRLLQDGNFAFRQVPGTQCSVELMSTYFPAHLNEPPRRFKLANLSFLNDPIAIYTNTAFHTRRDIPYIIVKFNAKPLRKDFMLKIGGGLSTANATRIVTPTLPAPFPSGPLLPTLFGRALSSPHARIAFSKGLQYYRPWDLGAFLLAVMGKLESQHHWHEDSPFEQNERWNGKDAWEKWRTGVDHDGDWDMDNGFRKPLTINQIVVKERELLAQYQEKGFWYMREWGEDMDISKMHVALTPVSDWVWEVCH
ncbi:uncharacterized protein DFL_006588 [Arthrobotrys flagrans]|uniref:F-box domain-containing protein n=1 Tax=Arthrobotrys flagrans TaxID=97331 RepID=A0A436ZT76_ARTFL|nr:hypothetical protein DFL_006588 [Arthrobotrys flagrans]